MKKIGIISLVLLAGLTLTGCSQNSKQNTAPKKNATAKTVKNNKKPTRVGHLSAQDLTPQKTVAVVVAYAVIVTLAVGIRLCLMASKTGSKLT